MRSSSAGEVADVGCGHGASTLIMAKAYPKAQFVRLRLPRVDRAGSRAARQAGLVEDRVKFDVAPAKDIPGDSYDLVAMFDCLHDMGDPVGAAPHCPSLG